MISDTELAHLAAQAVWYARETRKMERRAASEKRRQRARELLGRVRSELRTLEKKLNDLA